MEEVFKNIDEQRLWNNEEMWSDGGHEWSKSFGTTENLWNNHIFDDVKEYRGKIKSEKIILHCFCGKKALIREAVKKGYCFSIPTNIVRSSSFKQLVKICPIEQIFTETDGPYLSPFKNEDKSFNRNEPGYIKESIKIIAEVKQISEEEVEQILEKNFKRVFGVKL